MATRRSSRERKAAVSIYDEAKEELKRSPKSRGKNNDDDDDNDDDVSELSDLMKDDLGQDESSSSSSDESVEAPKKSRRKSPNKKGGNRIQVQVKKPAAAKNKKKSAATKIPKGPNKTRVLESLRARTLDPEEQPDNSLAAAILAACTPRNNKSKSKKNNKRKKSAADSDEENDDDADDDDDNSNKEGDPVEYPDAFVPTQYTALLEPVVKDVLAQFQNQDEDDHAATISLLNLIFRCVGGSYQNLLPADAALDDMDDEEWAVFVTDIVDDMRLTPTDAILISSNPKGEVQEADKKKHNAAQEEFRHIYEHFWYLFGTLALTSVTTGIDGTNPSEEASFHTELLKDLSTRLIELVTVGQPAMRAAATVASLQLAKACCDGTLALTTRLTTVKRQWNAAKKAKTSTKEKTLRALVKSLERSNKDVEHVFADTIIPGVFVRRYRDSDPQIRASCLETGIEMMLKRPDFFLQDVYLKYYCWMISDKEAIVRAAALKGLFAPFARATEQSNMNTASIHPVQVIDVECMEKCFEKFLPRVIECVSDKDPMVQEIALKLLLVLMRHGFLDDIEDNSTWNKINLHALVANTTPEVRREALYFILEQLEPFDSNTPLHQKKGSERQRAVFQIDALASWIGHAIADGSVPTADMKVSLTDFVIQSLSAMPKHAHLTTDFEALLKCIELDTQKKHDETKNPRTTIAKQRVLLRMLVCSASLALDGKEASNNGDDDNDNGARHFTDPDMVKIQTQLQSTSATAANGKKKTKSESESLSTVHEKLTIGLIKALPKLLPAFKGDIPILRILTRLPKFLIVSGITLPQRKDDVQTLTNLLGEMFLESTDITVLQNACLSLSVLARGNHSRNQEAFLKLQDVAKDVRNRLLWLYRETPTSTSAPPNSTPAATGGRRRTQRSTPLTQDGMSEQSSQTSRDSDSNADESRSLVMDRQHAISLCLTRLRILSQKWYLGDLLSEPAKSQEESTVEERDVCASLGNTIATSLCKELMLRQIQDLENDEGLIGVPDIWNKEDQGGVHYVVAHSVREGLNLILAMISFRFCKLVKTEKAGKAQARGADDDDDDDDGGSQPGRDDMELDDATAYELDSEVKLIVRMRDGLQKLLGLCFDQYLDSPVLEENILTPEHVAFATNVQLSACQVASDVRTLFSKKCFEKAASPRLRQCALLDDSHAQGGGLRFFRSKEKELASSARLGKPFKIVLAPIARAVLGSKHANRREAGAILCHIDHPSQEASKAVVATSRILKKTDLVRFMEITMASLVQSFGDWVETEPDELETEHPSEEEMEAFVAAEEKHEEAFKVLEQRAARLAASLGVARLKDEKQYAALFGFVKEGIRFAFSNPAADSGSEEPCLGSQLSFLRLLNKYLPWAKRMKTELKHLQKFYVEHETKLRAHPDFEEVREEDIEAMDLTRTGLGLGSAKEKTPKKKKKAKRRSSVSTLDSGDDDEDSFMTPSGSRRRISHTGSVLSVLSNLSPIDEAGSNEDENVPTEQLRKKRKVSALTIREGSDEDDGSQSQPAQKDAVMSEDDDSVPNQALRKKRKEETPTQSVSQATIRGSDEESRSSASAASTEM